MSVEITNGTGPKVLLVEDDPAIRNLLGQWLKREGFAVVAAADGMEACNAATSERPDLALVDLMLPKRDGYSVLMYLRSREALRDLIEGRRHRSGIGQLEGYREGAAAHRLDLLHGRLGLLGILSIRQRTVRTLGGETQRDAAPDPP